MDAKNNNRLTTRKEKKNNRLRNEEKFELVSCPLGGFHCKDSILPKINRLYRESDIYRVNREYEKSIELLNEAYQTTLELKQSSCFKCVGFFQNNITETMEIIQKELNQMSKGIFSTRRYQNAYIKLGEILNYMNLYRENGSYLLSPGNGK